jgi:SAM-dependent methyltransferase
MINKTYKSQNNSDYYGENAFSPLRIESITEQLRLICNSGYKNILEIGIGNGFLKKCFSLYPDIHHVTLDIDKNLCPDYIGSVTNMPFEENQFDLVVCGQVLEHLPFSDFLPSLKEIRRVARYQAIISLPDNRRRFVLEICLPPWGWFQYEWNMSRRRYKRKFFDFKGVHYWEIGYKGTSGKEIDQKIKEAGFTIEKKYRLRKYSWHCFYILRP